jgi:branched-chain amino acid transport system ATP-binding protein
VTEILTANGVSKAFGSVQAVAGITMDVRKGEILGILGPNGSGKTTLFNLLTGVHKPDGGRVVFGGRDITRMSVHERVRLGIGRTYQIPRPFGNMTVLENLLVAATQGGRKREVAARRDIDEILEMTGLEPLKYQFARTLTLLDRKRLETARALATNPDLLLLDEIAGGLTEAEARQVLKIIQAVNERGVTIIWIEHLLAMMEGVDRILALDQGRHLLCGAPEDVMRSEEVVACYMGIEEDA